ncbi:integrase/recombinase xerD homolog [Montipora capricornis]|uniref:integrase/recombinase xerD homolog n=1 Tax=Montipora capricornis TaxID=246305 RepID=UPI0035F1701D
MAGLESCPVSNPLVKSALEGAKRKLARSVRPKEPLSVDTIQAIADFCSSDISLAVLRFLSILVVGFYGFFRIDEINSFRLHDIIVDTDHMTIYVAKRKNDQYREGHTSYLARSGKSTCLVSITEKILKVLPRSSKSFPIVRRIVKSKAGECFHASRGVSVSTLRKEFKKFIEPFVDDISKYSMHSMRSGAASNPACRLVPGDLLDMNAGWRCPSSKNRYIKHTVKDRLTVSKALLL